MCFRTSLLEKMEQEERSESVMDTDWGELLALELKIQEKESNLAI